MKKRNAHAEALTDLHSMLSEAISQKLKAKAAKKGHAPAGADLNPEQADSPEEELGENGEAMDPENPGAKRKKLAFGHKGL